MERRRAPWLRSLAATVLLASGVFLALAGLRAIGALQPLELLLYDAYLGWRVARAGPEREVVIVAITDADVDGDTTLDDGRLAAVLERLVAAQPAAIGLDLLRHTPVPPGEAALDRVLRGHPEIVVISGYDDAQQEGRAAPAAVDDPSRIGFADMDLDPDGILRRGLLYLSGGDAPGTALALRLAARYLAARGIHPEPDGPHLRLGATTYVPLQPADGGYATLTPGGYQFLLSLPACGSGIATLAVGDIVAGALQDHELRGRVVVLGNQVRDAKDVFKLPVECAGGVERQVYGVGLHAQIVSQLIRQASGEAAPVQTLGQVLRDPARGRAAELAWIWLWTVAGAVSAWRFRRPVALATVAGTGLIGLISLTVLAFLTLGWWLPVVPPALGAVVALGAALGYVLAREKLKQARLERLFSAYVSPSITPILWRDEDHETAPPAARELVATVLFSDIRGFTPISELLPEPELMSWLNEYMSVMADLVLAHDGTIEKFAGDGLTAEFGVPEPRTSDDEIAADARAAVDCARAMGASLVELNRRWAARGLPEIGIRVGIHTGPIVLGNLGSARRMQYSVIGDTANTAARLESWGKDDPALNRDGDHCRILISEATSAHLDAGYRMELVGSLRLKGKQQPITVYRVLGGPEAAPGERRPS